MQKLAINQHYPFPVNEGATASLLSQSGNLLQLGLSGITEEEKLAFKKAPIKIGIIAIQPVILWLFDFGKGGQYDSPFDARLYSRTQLNLLDIDNAEQRLLIDLHVIELTNQILKVLRVFTLPPQLTRDFLSAVQDQLAQPVNTVLYNQKLNELYKLPIEATIKKTHMYKGGD